MAEAPRPPHRFARLSYNIRMASFAYTFVTLMVLIVDRGFSFGEVIAGAITFLLYPQAAYFHARIASDAKRAEFRNYVADTVLLGAWAAQMRFALWPTCALLLAVSLNSTAAGGLRHTARALACFAAAALAWGAVTGFAFDPTSSPLVTGMCMVGIIGYATWLGYALASQNRELLRVRNALRLSAEQFRFIAENVGDLVTVLDGQGRIQYASGSHRSWFNEAETEPGADWLLLVHPDDRVRASHFIGVLRTTKSAANAELRLVPRNGVSRVINCEGNMASEDGPAGAGQNEMLVLVCRHTTSRVNV